MIRGKHPAGLTLGIAATTRGFAWAAFNDPCSLYDRGMVFVQSDKNYRCFRHFERLLDRLEPTTVVMEEDSTKAFRSSRMRLLHRTFRIAVRRRGIDLSTYGRSDVLRAFATLGASTNQEIAEAVARCVPGLAHKLPRKRLPWVGEDRRVTLFSAAALAMTHFHIGGAEFLEDMKPAA